MKPDKYKPDKHNSHKKLRLYMLRYGKYGAPVRDSTGKILYYDNKVTAKQDRDELNANLTKPIFVVTHGPDNKNRPQTALTIGENHASNNTQTDS